MANVQPRYSKDGRLISYSIRVFRGRDASGKTLKPFTATFEVEPTWTEKSARKKAEAFAAQFEQQCKSGLVSDSRKKFEPYCGYVIDMKEERGIIKHSTAVRYRELASRINKQIGHKTLRDITVADLNDLYTKLSQEGERRSDDKSIAKVNLPELLKEKKLSRSKLAEKSGCPCTTICSACNGNKITKHRAMQIAEGLSMDYDKLFLTEVDRKPLSSKTVIEHARLVSMVLEMAYREGLIASNIADRAQLPKLERHEADYLEPEQIIEIVGYLEDEPIMWRTLINLLIMSGCRRGEALALKWNCVDFENNRIHICNNIQYSSDCGIYITSPKTESSNRYISLPQQTMQLLRAWKDYQAAERRKAGIAIMPTSYLFSQANGEALHPDSVNNWLDGFSKRHGLPHLHPHQLRHSQAGILLYNGVDVLSISKRLGHSSVQITTDIYSHIIASADARSADVLGQVILSKKQA